MAPDQQPQQTPPAPPSPDNNWVNQVYGPSPTTPEAPYSRSSTTPAGNVNIINVKHLPIGVVIIALISLLGSVSMFISLSSTAPSILNTTLKIASGIAILAAMGLLVLSNAARLFTVFCTMLVIALNIALFYKLHQVTGSLNSSSQKTITSLNQALAQDPTPENQQKVSNIENQLTTARSDLDTVLRKFYLVHGVAIAFNVAVIYYLTRPPVRLNFE